MKRLDSYLQGQGHKVGWNHQNITFFHVSWTLLFATKFGIVVDHHKPECCATILDCCPQGRGHSETVIGGWGDDWLIAWLIDWLIDWLINYLIAAQSHIGSWSNDRLIDWLVAWLMHMKSLIWGQSIDWLIAWLIDWLIDWLIGWLTGCLIAVHEEPYLRLEQCLIDSLLDW